jgi:hypothetical protein
MDWLVAVDVAGPSPMVAFASLQWVPLESLHSSTSPIEYQDWAAARVLSLGDGPAERGPFGHPAWPSEVRAWIERVLGASAASACPEVVAHRLSSHEVVLEWRTSNGRWFFKGLAPDRVVEATLTSAMARLMPESFARTVALESRPDGGAWWLMEACPGTPLAERLTIDGAVLVVEAYAKAQQAMAREIAQGRDVGMPIIDVPGTAAWAKSSLADGGDGSSAGASALAIDEACADVGSVGPRSWVAADLDPTNVIVDGGDVRFIDLDDALLGPAPLAVATLARRIERGSWAHGWSSTSTGRLIDAYERAWTPHLHVAEHWETVGLVSQLVECHLAWQRVTTMIERGEVHGVQGVVRAATRRRVWRAVDRYRGLRQLS